MTSAVDLKKNKIFLVLREVVNVECPMGVFEAVCICWC